MAKISVWVFTESPNEGINHCLLWKSLLHFHHFLLLNLASVTMLPFFKLLQCCTSKHGINMLCASGSLSFTWQGAADAFKLVSSFHYKKKTQKRCSVWCFSLWGTRFYKGTSQLETDDVEGAVNSPRDASYMCRKTDMRAHLQLNRSAATNIHSVFENAVFS